MEWEGSGETCGYVFSFEDKRETDRPRTHTHTHNTRTTAVFRRTNLQQQECTWPARRSITRAAVVATRLCGYISQCFALSAVLRIDERGFVCWTHVTTRDVSGRLYTFHLVTQRAEAGYIPLQPPHRNLAEQTHIHVHPSAAFSRAKRSPSASSNGAATPLPSCRIKAMTRHSPGGNGSSASPQPWRPRCTSLRAHKSVGYRGRTAHDQREERGKAQPRMAPRPPPGRRAAAGLLLSGRPRTHDSCCRKEAGRRRREACLAIATIFPTIGAFPSPMHRNKSAQSRVVAAPIPAGTGKAAQHRDRGGYVKTNWDLRPPRAASFSWRWA